jgi:regulator of protease activity HflC (stomatin/prohibitin superfamily)
MEQNAQKTGLINWVTLLAVTAVAVALARLANSATGIAGAVFLGLGFLVAAASYLQMRLEERERLEQLEFDELKKAKGESALFAEAADTFPARRSREQFERFLIPAFTILLVLLQGVGTWGLWQWLNTVPPPQVDRATLTMALYAVFFLLLFVLGKYSANLARLNGQHLLRPGASYLLLGSVICLLVAAAEAAALFGFAQVDRYVARGLTVFLGLTAAETLVGLVFEIYRPRVRGRAARLLYESRLIGLMGQPGGLITTAAQALDYQFGFKVSETWFYRFLEKALAWLILLQLAVLSLSTMLVIIEPSQQGLLERFGRPVTGRSVLEPGLHLKWPWPIDQVRLYTTRQIHTFTVGVVPDPELDKETTVLWTRPHYKEEFNMLVASADQPERVDRTGEKPVPANLLAVSIPVQYQITNLVAWAYEHTDADALLKHLASREVVRYLVAVDFEDIMSTGRLVAAEQLRERIQRRADERRLGIHILFVGLQGIHPPIGTRSAPVAAAFEQVVGAIQQKQTNILAAQAYAAEKLPRAAAEATNLLAQARSDRTLKVATAAAESSRFTNQVAAWEASPSVYAQKAYLETFTRAAGPVRKYVLATTNTQDILIMNLEETIRADLLRDVVLPPEPGARPPAK